MSHCAVALGDKQAVTIATIARRNRTCGRNPRQIQRCLGLYIIPSPLSESNPAVLKSQIQRNPPPGSQSVAGIQCVARSAPRASEILISQELLDDQPNPRPRMEWRKPSFQDGGYGGSAAAAFTSDGNLSSRTATSYFGAPRVLREPRRNDDLDQHPSRSWRCFPSGPARNVWRAATLKTTRFCREPYCWTREIHHLDFEEENQRANYRLRERGLRISFRSLKY